MGLDEALLLFAAAGLGGAINSVAGGGTFLTFPTLMLGGLSPVQANVTSTVALWPGSLSSAAAYRDEWKRDRAILPALILISILGSTAGAFTLLYTPERTFAKLVPWLLLAAAMIFTFGRWVIARAHFIRHPVVARAIQLLIAFYGGYFGAGIGILMLAMLQLMGFTHIHRMNALKTVLGGVINAVAVLIFVASGAVVWRAAAVMIVGAVAGGYAGAHVARKLPPEPVRIGVSIIAFAMTGYFFLHRA